MAVETTIAVLTGKSVWMGNAPRDVVGTTTARQARSALILDVLMETAELMITVLRVKSVARTAAGIPVDRMPTVVTVESAWAEAAELVAGVMTPAVPVRFVKTMNAAWLSSPRGLWCRRDLHRTGLSTRLSKR